MTASVPAPRGELRRAPVQERSSARVARILQAAGDLLVVGGYEAMTTKAVAGRAGVSIGSFYQYFPDKASLVRELSRRNLDLFTERLGELAAAGRPKHWADAADQVVELYLQLCRRDPVFRVLGLGEATATPPPVATGGGVATEALSERIADLLASQWGVQTSPEARLSLLVCVEVAAAVVRLAFRRVPDGDPAVLGRLRALLAAQLAPTA